MRMEKRKFRIGELAKHLNVERFVIRFWEKEFAIKTTRSTGGQRFYSEQDLQTFIIIKELLYQKGFTISGARNYLHQMHKNKLKSASIIASQKTTFDEGSQSPEVQKIVKSLTLLREQLMRLQELL